MLVLPAMFTTTAVSLDALTRALDQLPGPFVSGVLAQEDSGQLVDSLLKQIGETLALNHASFESCARGTATWRVPHVWIRPGTGVACDRQLTIPVVVRGQHLGVLSLGSHRYGGDGHDPQTWPAAIEERLTLLAGLLTLVDRWSDRASASSPAIAGESSGYAGRRRDDGDEADSDFKEIIGDSPALRLALRRVLEVAPTDASVVLVGETGTGKELFARAVHDRSRRRGRPFVRVNCAALPPTLIESELFGHERGAFTGAVSMRRGRFELAHTGTLFLDEIGDLPTDVQAKLLRVLQEGEFERVGSSESRRVDVRIVAATHHDLEAAVKDGRFRADLYYRLSVFPIALPPLRERAEDVPRLVWFFINQRQRALNRRFTSIPAHVLAALQQHSWPGNVRELENVIERAMIHSTGHTLLLDEGPGLPVLGPPQEGGTLEHVERRHIESVLRRCRWRINGPGNAADVLGLHPNTLRFRMKKLGVQRPKELAVVIDSGRLSA